MRNFFLALVLANLLFLAWYAWIDPSPTFPPVNESGDLVVFGAGPVAAPTGAAPGQASGACLRVGPLPDSAAAQQARERLAAKGVDAVAVAQDSQEWIGHWVQIDGFSSLAAAETAQQRLIGAGLVDAYLMQDGPEPMISLGVFRDRERADRLAATARNTGYDVQIRDRYRPAVELWLLVSPRAGQVLAAADVSIAGDRIMRTENTPCKPDSSASSD